MQSDKTLNKMRSALSAVGIPTPSDKDPIVLDESAKLNIIAWGDPQISSVSPLRSSRLSGACRDIANMQGKADVLMLLGDICEFGKEAEFRMTAGIINEVSDKYEHFLAVSGNHDIRLKDYKSQLERFNRFIKSVEGGIAGPDTRYYFSTEINSYKFIMMGSDSAAFESSHISDRQIEWLDTEIASCGGKPVFVLNHQTLKRTNGLPVTWLGKGSWRGSVGRSSDKIKAVFEKHKNVIFITGHLHYGVSQYNFEDYGAYKSLSLPTVGVLNHGNFSKNGQGYIISVYSDRIVMRARVFGDGKYVDKGIPNSYIEFALD